jgi:NAD(P)H-dependent FMN reductase
MTDRDSYRRTTRFSQAGAQFDSFVFATPEYNHGPSAALKNAIDFRYREWNNKSVGFVRMVTVAKRALWRYSARWSATSGSPMRAQIGRSLFTDFEDFATGNPGPHLEPTVTTMLDQVNAWDGNGSSPHSGRGQATLHPGDDAAPGMVETVSASRERDP